jgi:hypothetical protein
LKGDFFREKEGDRTCKIELFDDSRGPTGTQQQHDEQWTDLLLKLRDTVMNTFDSRCAQYEHELRQINQQRGSVGEYI